jgi:hypothetical protein
MVSYFFANSTLPRAIFRVVWCIHCIASHKVVFTVQFPITEWFDKRRDVKRNGRRNDLFHLAEGVSPAIDNGLSQNPTY